MSTGSAHEIDITMLREYMAGINKIIPCHSGQGIILLGYAPEILFPIVFQFTILIQVMAIFVA